MASDTMSLTSCISAGLHQAGAPSLPAVISAPGSRSPVCPVLTGVVPDDRRRPDVEDWQHHLGDVVPPGDEVHCSSPATLPADISLVHTSINQSIDQSIN